MVFRLLWLGPSVVRTAAEPHLRRFSYPTIMHLYTLPSRDSSSRQFSPPLHLSRGHPPEAGELERAPSEDKSEAARAHVVRVM